MGASVFDINKRLGFPNRHPLSVSFHGDAFNGVDLVAALDVVDWTRGSHKLNTQTREITVVTAPECKWIDVGLADIEISKWATDYNKHHNWDHRVLGDSALTIPALTAACKKRIEGNKALASRIDERKKTIGEKHARQWQKWQEQVKEQWNERPMTEARLAHEIWQVIENEDWVLTANTLKEWVHKVWNFDRPYRHVGHAIMSSDIFLYALISYLYGALPFAFIATYLITRKKLNGEGTGNVGVTNAFKAGGYAVGIAAVAGEISKALLPLCLAHRFFSGNLSPTLVLSSTVRCLDPVFQFFSKGKGVKAPQFQYGHCSSFHPLPW